ncbi:MAG: ABC transporter substrate-binding protein [Balneolaceae bacterium]
MKPFLYIFSLFFAFAIQLQAQDFDYALELYENEEYEEAVRIFESIDNDRSALYAGKSHFSIGNYTRSISFLNNALESSLQSIRDEALFTLSVSHFMINNFDISLTFLKELIESNNRTGLRMQAQRMYNQILNYLSMEERFQTLKKLNNQTVRYDLVNASKNYTDAETYRLLVREFIKTEPDSANQTGLRQNLLPGSELQQFFNRYPTAPAGMVFHVGVVLPTFDENDPDFTIPRNLYYGMILAADEFNSRNSDKKVRLNFKNSAENPDSTGAGFTELVWADEIDAVIGPLFSEPAERMAQLAEEYRVPMLAPLANSDELNLDYNYTFQMNPTFEIHGRNMARFAVEELRLDTLAVITESNALGRASALGFRYEAEKLGAHISYYIEEDFASMGYDLSEHTEVFTPDSTLQDSLKYTPSQAVYAPFTGEAATTLTNLLMNDLEAMRSNMIILGSEEWTQADLNARQQQFFEIYYTQATGEAADSSAVDFFEEDFENRFGFEADRFAKTGYDAANYLFRSLETAGNPHYLGRVMRTEDPYNGLSTRIHFDGKRVNQHVFIRPLTSRAIERFDNEPE